MCYDIVEEQVAGQNNDRQMTDFIESEFLSEKVNYNYLVFFDIVLEEKNNLIRLPNVTIQYV